MDKEEDIVFKLIEHKNQLKSVESNNILLIIKIRVDSKRPNKRNSTNSIKY